jgi:hypothetical protein
LAICVGELPVVVRVDVARGTRGIVVWVNVVRVLSVVPVLVVGCVRVAYMWDVPIVFGFLSFLSFFTQPLFHPPPTTSFDARN